MAYYVGMRAGRGEVSAILEDDHHLHKFGKKRYLIYIENDDGYACYGSASTGCLACWNSI